MQVRTEDSAQLIFDVGNAAVVCNLLCSVDGRSQYLSLILFVFTLRNDVLVSLLATQHVIVK
jgi:hypothetical protein